MIRYQDLLAGIAMVDEADQITRPGGRMSPPQVEAYARVLFAAATIHLNGTSEERCAGPHQFGEIRCELCGTRGSIHIAILGRDEGYLVHRPATDSETVDSLAQALTEAAVDRPGTHAEAMAVRHELTQRGWEIMRVPNEPRP